MFKMLHFSLNSRKCFLDKNITDIGVLYFDRYCFIEGVLGKTLISHGETGEGLLSAIQYMYVFMNILLMVCNQKETVHSLLSEQNWPEMFQSKTVLLSIFYLFAVNVYHRHTCFVKVFHTYPQLSQSLKQYKYDTNWLHVTIHWACHSGHIQKLITYYYLLFNQ